MATMSIGRVFTWLARRHPERVAVQDPDGSVTFAELERRANRMAHAFLDLGVAPDDLVTMALGNSVEAYVVCAAIWKAGAIPQPVSARLPEPELAAVIDTADPALVIGLERPGRQSLPAGWSPSDAHPDTPPPDLAASSWKAPASSGSTGRPKVILSGTPATTDPERPTAAYIPSSAVQLVAGPLHHSAPFLFSMRGLFLGHRLVVLSRFDPEEALRTIERERVTWAMLVPTMMHRIWRLGPDRRDCADVSSIESILHVGAPCPAWLKRAWIEWLGPERVWEIYAGTEASGVTVIGGADWLRHPGSVGRPTPGYQFRVIGGDGRVAAPGTIGAIQMRSHRGPGATYRYLGSDPDRTADGWDSIGDLGWVDDDGWWYLADRAHDLIITAGTNVYPAEVEAVLDERCRSG